VPDGLKKFAKRAYGFVPARYRVDRGYLETKLLLREAQWWDQEKIRAWQLQRFKDVVQYAYSNVPGYRLLYDSARIRPEDVRCFNDIAALPPVTKELMRSNIEDFTSRSILRSKRIRVQTSGSTGVPFEFYRTEQNPIKESAFMHTSWEWVGWNLGDVSAVLRGKFVGSEKKFWSFDPLRHELRLSSYYLTEKLYESYIKTIQRYNPSHLMAYPSAATALADLVVLNGDVGRVNFKSIFLGSENIYEWQKQRMHEAFPGAKLFGWYGHAEEAVFAPMCEDSDLYHIWPFYGFSEVLNDRGQEVDPGDVGMLIGTSFWNDATPFIRYQTADFVKTGRFGCDKCGRQFQLLEAIDGRARDILISRNGRRIPAFGAANMDVEVIRNIKQFQFYQKNPGKVFFRVLRKDTYTEDDTAKIQHALRKNLGDDMEVEITFPKTIQKSSGGKAVCFDRVPHLSVQ
jgi:phenylacetate-CoA ligase